ncbi:MAG: HEAT repeat domain-containing protein, partial [Candidatus Hodarchaeota archaeon]
MVLKEQKIESLSEKGTKNLFVQKGATPKLSNQNNFQLVELLANDFYNTNNYQSLCEKTVKALGTSADVRAVKPLGQILLDNKKEEIRIAAVRSLYKISPIDALVPFLDLLIKALGDDSFHVQFFGMKTLVRMDNLAFRRVLETLLRDKNPRARIAAAKVLGEMGDLRAIGPLLKCLKDDYYRLRRAIAWVLGDLKNKKAIKPLIKALTDERPEVKEAAAWSLGKLGSHRATKMLINTLKNKEEPQYVRGNAAEALGTIGDVRGLEPLLNALKDKNDWVRQASARGLGRLGDPRAVDSLIENLKNRNYLTREACAWSLGRLGCVRAVKPLVKAMIDSNDSVRESATEALKTMGNLAIGPLSQILRGQNGSIHDKTSAARVLGEIGGEKVIEPLLEGLSTSIPQVRMTCSVALAKLGKPIIPVIISFLSQPKVEENEDLLTGALRVLVSLSLSKEQLKPLVPLLLAIIFNGFS